MVLLQPFASWLMKKNKTALLTGLACLLGLFSLRTLSFINAGNQQQLIVYNIPKHQAIDFIDGRHYFFKGDDALLTDNLLQNFHLLSLAASCTGQMLQIPLQIFCIPCPFLSSINKRIVLIDKAYSYRNSQ